MEYVYDINNVNRIKEIVEYSFTFNGESEFPYSYTSDPFAMVTKVLKYKTVYEYDNYGFVTSETIYAPDGNVNISSLSVYTKRTYIYDTDGSSKIFGALLSTKDSLIETKYFYDNATGWLLASVNVGTGDGYAYSYDRMGRLSKVTPGHLTSSNDYNVITSKEHVNYSYDSSNRLSEISTAKTIYVFTYDDFGNTESISIGNKIIAEYEYESHNGKIKRITYGNGYEVEYVYNELEQLAQTKYRTDANSEFVIAYEYKYTADGQVYSLRDNVIGRITVYLYDADGKMVGYKEFDDTDDSAVIWTNISYDGYSRVSNVTNTFTYNSGAAVATDTISGAYTYLDDGKLSNYLICSNLTSNTHYVYDTLDRISSIVYNNAEGSNHLNISYEYSYLTFSSYGTTSYVGTFESTVGNHSTRYDYAYSSDGNLVGMRDYDSNEVVYEYDDLGQLLSEDNDFINARYTYSYDHAGNLVQTTSILYNLSSDLISNTYSYTNSKWGDLLTAFNGVAIFYDKIGNPLRYYNGSPYNFTWQGRRLVGAVTSDKNMSFTYNVDGLRTSKNVNGITTHYIYDGNILLSEYTDTEIIVYIYDALGSPIGFKYRDSSYETDVWDVYWYEKNLQGDIVAIYDTIGTKLVSYAYNAWGITFINYYEDGENTTAIKNNLTYRGYYYDSDLELYYLQSRYYDSKTCRFINADALMSGVTGSLKGYNLYAYCFNNPIAFTDSEGNWPKFFEKVAEIFVAVLESIEAEVATGYGVGFEIEATIHSVDVVIEAIAAQKDFIELDDGNLNRGYKGEISGAIGVSIFELGANISDSHYYSDEKCNCDPWRDSISDKSTCKANQTTISSPSLSIGFGVGLYLGVGANASISINLTELHQRIVSIYKEEI